MRAPAGNILVVGLGASGCAAASYLAALDDGQARKVIAIDSSDSADLRAAAKGLELLGVDVRLGVDEVDGVYALGVVSPGVPPSAPVFRSARSACGELISEVELAYRVSEVPWIAVTGTNGKTTTTELIAHLLRQDGIVAVTAGNIGRPAIEAVAAEEPSSILVVEVSSFQLATTSRFHPRVAVLLNITPDHIDWHGSMEQYMADKGAIFANIAEDDTAIIDAEDAVSSSYISSAEEHGATVVRVSVGQPIAGGAGVGGDLLTIPVPGGSAPLVSRSDIAIRGDHNVSNALAASAAAYACGAGLDAIREGLVTFRPIEHRLEPVTVVDDVEYVNDSKATNPDATMKAITAFPERPLILLLGGRNKGASFDQLAVSVASKVKLTIAFGEAGAEIADALEAAGAQHRVAETMLEAVKVSIETAVPGDAVLLSPACASFDEFRSYIERGEVFKSAVRAIGEAGPDAS